MNTKNPTVKRLSVKELQVEARMLDIDGRAKMNRVELVLAIAAREKFFNKAFPGREARLKA